MRCWPFKTTRVKTQIVKQSNTHYNDVIMSAIASQITSLTIVYSTVYSDADQRKHQSSASLAFVWGIHRGPVNSPHKWPVTRKMFPFDDVIMEKERPSVWQPWYTLKTLKTSFNVSFRFCLFWTASMLNNISWKKNKQKTWWKHNQIPTQA